MTEKLQMAMYNRQEVTPDDPACRLGESWNFIQLEGQK